MMQPNTMLPDDLLLMGYIKGAFGIKGWVKIHTNTAERDGLFDYPVWYVSRQPDLTSPNWQKVDLLNGAVHQKDVVAQLSCATTRSEAEALQGFTIAVPRSALPKPANNEYYWHDLIGLNAVNLKGESFGVVADLMESGAHDILVLKKDQQQWLVPLVGQFVKSTDLETKTLLIDWELDY